LALLGAAGAASAGDVSQGQVERVIDGDTISVLTTGYERLRVRLYGIDTPERGQAWGAEATAALRGMVDGREVELDVLDVDRYSRQVAVVTTAGQGENINLRLVQEGHAWVYGRYCEVADLCRLMAQAEEEARSRGAGLWSQPEPEAPWDYRRRGR
jgi:endonuclease YncB( thermonuclease family)